MRNKREFEPNIYKEEGLVGKEDSLCKRLPHEMPLKDFKEEYERIMGVVSVKEKKGGLDPENNLYKPVSQDKEELLKRDWKEFSRKRGFSEEDIEEYVKDSFS